MAVSTTTRRISYTGNGATLAFAYPFRILDAAHLKVYVDTVLQSSGYAVSGVGGATGGTVTFSAAPANGAVVLLLRDVPLTQTVDTQNNETILEDVLDTSLDKLTMIAQQIAENIGRSPTLGAADVDGSGAYAANGNRISNLGAPTAQTDAARVADISAIVAAAGNVPSPLAGDAGKFLKASGAAAFGWTAAASSDLSDFAEAARDTIGAALVAGTNITITVNDAGDTITITNTGPTTSDVSAAIEANRAFRSQCAQMGPKGNDNNPNFLPATSGSLLLQTQNITASDPLIVHASQGRGGRTASITANITWSPLASSSTVFLGLTIDANGTATPFSTTTAPIYQRGGVPSTTNGQYTYVIGSRTMYLGDGSAANKVYAVFVGECTTSGSAVTATVAYAFEGRMCSPQTAIPAGGTITTFNHNIGVRPDFFDVMIANVTTQHGYSPGDVLRAFGDSTSNNQTPLGMVTGRNSAQVNYGTTLIVPVRTTGAIASITRTSWEYIFYADRGWD
jgi:hypothetical protein